VPKFELHKHNDELFNIYYGIFYELWTFVDFDRLCKCSFIMNTTRDCTCNRLFFVITMLHNLNIHIEIYLCSWSFDTTFFRDGVHFIYRI
jgi:hypothetical protein